MSGRSYITGTSWIHQWTEKIGKTIRVCILAPPPPEGLKKHSLKKEIALVSVRTTQRNVVSVSLRPHSFSHREQSPSEPFMLSLLSASCFLFGVATLYHVTQDCSISLLYLYEKKKFPSICLSICSSVNIYAGRSKR